MDTKDLIFTILAFIAGLATNLITEMYRNLKANKDAYVAINAEIESNIESAKKGVLSDRLWSNNVYIANLHRLRKFRHNIKKVVQFYFKIENYKDRYLQYVGIIAKLQKAMDSHSVEESTEHINMINQNQNVSALPKIEKDIEILKSQAVAEKEVLKLLASEIQELGGEIIKKHL